ncbi:MAG: hypothetical protein HGB30_12535, partial [Holophagaceae bacterium]|nr:hypothetical protein [Holophagaceae bacterium]
ADTASVIEIYCILPRPGEPAIQRLLPPEVWESAYTRMLSLLRQEFPRA